MRRVTVGIGLAILTVFMSLVYVLRQGSGASQKKLLNQLYRGVNGFKVTKCEREEVAQQGGAPTYGEIPFESFKVILDELDITKEDVFYDLGSGVGKSVLQVLLTTPVKKSVGIEISPTRFSCAEAIKRLLMKSKKMPKGKILEFREQDILEADMDDATIVYMCSTCYSPALMQGIVDMLQKLSAQKFAYYYS